MNLNQIDTPLQAVAVSGIPSTIRNIAALALTDENVQRFVADQEVRKTIVVPGRLVNIVV